MTRYFLSHNLNRIRHNCACIFFFCARWASTLSVTVSSSEYKAQFYWSNNSPNCSAQADTCWHFVRDLCDLWADPTWWITPSWSLNSSPIMVSCSDLSSACLSSDTGMMLSSWSTSTIEEVAEASPGAVRWMQLYVYKDRALTQSLVRRAEDAGYKGIFVTVDTPYLGRRRDDVRNRFKLPSHLR